MQPAGPLTFEDENKLRTVLAGGSVEWRKGKRANLCWTAGFLWRRRAAKILNCMITDTHTLTQTQTDTHIKLRDGSQKQSVFWLQGRGEILLTDAALLFN